MIVYFVPALNTMIHSVPGPDIVQSVTIC